MDRNKLLIHIVALMFFMFSAHLLISKFHFYYSIWWMDIIMHFFGGVWVGLFFLYVFGGEGEVPKQFLGVLSFVLLVGIAWEFFEFFVFNDIGRDPFNMLDTLSDIFFDLAGGLCAILYIWKKQLR